MRCLAYLQTLVLQRKVVDYFVNVSWNVVVDVGNRKSLHIFCLSTWNADTS